MYDKKRLLSLGLVVTMSIMMATPAFAAPKNTNQVNSVNNKANTVIKKSNAKVGTLSIEDRELLFSMFDAKFYAKMYPNVVKVVGNDSTKLFNYFISNGLKEGQQINADFNVNAYRSAYSDLNAKYGTSILSYYKHYVTEGKAEGRTITTVEQAQANGIIVTDFGGNKMAVDESGSIVAGEAAEKIILTDKSYANAVDNIVAAELGVSPAQAFQMQRTEFIANVATVEGQAVADMISQVASQNVADSTPLVINTLPQTIIPETVIEWSEVSSTPLAELTEVLFTSADTLTKTPSIPATKPAVVPSKPVVTYNETAYQAAMAEWRQNEPKKETFSASYMEEKAEWQAEKPVRSDYDIETLYTTKAQAEAAYNLDYTNWANAEPKAEDYMTSTEKTNFENAKLRWENSKPQREDYKVTRYDTKDNADAAYQADCAKYATWNSWKTAEDKAIYAPNVTTAYTVSGTEYNLQSDALTAAKNAKRPAVAEKPVWENYKYNIYQSQEAATEKYNEDLGKYEAFMAWDKLDDSEKYKDFKGYSANRYSEDPDSNIDEYWTEEQFIEAFGSVEEYKANHEGVNFYEVYIIPNSAPILRSAVNDIFKHEVEKYYRNKGDFLLNEPDSENYVYHAEWYASQAVAWSAYYNDNASYDASCNAYREWEGTALESYSSDVNEVYKVGEYTFSEYTDALDQAWENAEPDNTIKEQPDEETYTYGGYTDENAATQAYENAVEEYVSETPAPESSDYIEESAEQYDADYDDWAGNEPTESDYTYPTAELEAQADANYNEAVSNWEGDAPLFDGNLSESENALYEEAHDSWEESEPNHEDYKN